MENTETLENQTEMKNALSNVANQNLLSDAVSALNRVNRVCFALAIGLVIVSIIAALGYYRRPKVIVAVQTADGQRIAQIDDVKFGATEQIQMGEDKLTDRDKREIVENFLQTFYGVDLASRPKDIQKALGMMIPDSAKIYYKALTEQGHLQRERDEAWSAGWKTDSFEIDRNDKNAASVIGTQTLRRVIGGKPKSERIQYKLFFTLHTEGKRDDSPLRTGYWIINFKSEELSRTEG